MQVLYLNYNSEKSGKDYSVTSEQYDITDYVTELNWSGSKDEVARKVELTLLNAPTDPNIEGIYLKLGAMVYLFDDEDNELFRGYVIERERGSSTTVKYTCYDMLFYLLKSKATYNFKKKTPKAIVEMVCKDMEVSVGDLPELTKKDKYTFFMKDRNIYEIIMAGYTKHLKRTGIEYLCYSTEGDVCVREIGEEWVEIALTDDSNIISTSDKESIAEVINRVRVYTEKGKLKKTYKDDDSIVEYGIFQSTYTKQKGVKGVEKAAKALFKEPTRTLEVEGMGYTDCVTGRCLVLIDSSTGNEGRFFIESDSHKWVDGVHTMKLSLSLDLEMDEQEADEMQKKGK